jgi:hypothetical protein
MTFAHRAIAALFFSAGIAVAQENATPALHLTLNYPPSSVVTPMFGALPKEVALIEITACNDTASPVVLSTGRVVQALRQNGIQALSRDAAISTMQRAENRTWQSILLRNATHAMNIVNFLVISKAVSLGPGLASALPGAQALLEAVVPEFAKDVPTQQYLNFDHDTLPDKTQLAALECAQGLAFTLKQSSPAPVTEISVPAAPAPATGK